MAHFLIYLVSQLKPLVSNGFIQFSFQINKGSQNTSHSVRDVEMEEREDEDEDEYFQEEGDDASEISSDDES